MHKKRILVDLDNTVCDLHGAWLGAYNREYGLSVQKSDVTTWDIHDHVQHGGEIYKYLEVPHFYRTLSPIAGAVDAIEAAQEFVDIRICSAHHADDGIASDKMWWVRNHMPYIARKDIALYYHTDEIKADGRVDDWPHNIIRYHAAWPQARLWSMRWPYNGHLSSITSFLDGDYNQQERFWSAWISDVQRWSTQ